MPRVGRCSGRSLDGESLRVSLYGRDGCVEDSFDVVAVRVERERSVVPAAVLGTNAGRAVVDRRCMPALDADGVRRPERDVCARRDAVSTWLCSDRVQREVVTPTAPEQDICIAFELTLAQHRESKFG